MGSVCDRMTSKVFEASLVTGGGDIEDNISERGPKGASPMSWICLQDNFLICFRAFVER